MVPWPGYREGTNEGATDVGEGRMSGKISRAYTQGRFAPMLTILWGADLQQRALSAYGRIAAVY